MSTFTLPAPTSRLTAYENGRAIPFAPLAPIAASHGAPWDGLIVEEHLLPPMEVPMRHVEQHLVLLGYNEPGEEPTECEMTHETGSERVTLNDGQICVMNSRHTWGGRKSSTMRGVVVAIEPEVLNTTAAELNGSFRSVELATRIDVTDTRVENLAQALLAEVRDGYPGGKVFGDSIRTALSVHLLHKYAPQPVAVAPHRGGIAPRRLQRVKDFVEAHLADDPSLEELAAVAGMSVYHFARLFKESTGTSPRRYLASRRVERAKGLLLSSGLTLSEVSEQLGFAHQSHFTSVFRKVVGVTPGAYRRAVA